MSQIDLIRAEIERRKKELEKDKTIHPANQAGRIKELDLILSRLSDLEKSEKPIEGFDGEFSKFSNDVDAEHSFPICVDEYKDFARHFYELGRQSKPTTAEGLEEASEKYSGYNVDCEGAFYEPMVRTAFKDGALWMREQMMMELSEKIASAYQLGLDEKERQTVNEAEKPCHTVEEWMEHIKNADQLTKDIFSKGPYNVLYDALNHPYRDCYDAIKEFGELCYQTAREQMMKEAVEGEVLDLGINYLDLSLFDAEKLGLVKDNKVKLIIVKED